MSRIAGIDVGGTFTDLIVVDDHTGEVRIAKVPTTVQNQAFGVLAALDAAGVDPSELQDIVPGTPTTTNTRLSRRARARPAHAADAVRPEGAIRPVDRAALSPRGRRAAGRRRRGTRAARRSAGRSGRETAHCARRRKR